MAGWLGDTAPLPRRSHQIRRTRRPPRRHRDHHRNRWSSWFHRFPAPMGSSKAPGAGPTSTAAASAATNVCPNAMKPPAAAPWSTPPAGASPRWGTAVGGEELLFQVDRRSRPPALRREVAFLRDSGGDSSSLAVAGDQWYERHGRERKRVHFRCARCAVSCYCCARRRSRTRMSRCTSVHGVAGSTSCPDHDSRRSSCAPSEVCGSRCGSSDGYGAASVTAGHPAQVCPGIAGDVGPDALVAAEDGVGGFVRYGHGESAQGASKLVGAVPVMRCTGRVGPGGLRR